MHSVQADCVERVVHTKTEEVLHHKINVSPRLPPKGFLESAWQVQHLGHAQRGDSTVELIADEVTMEPKMDFRISGKLRAEVQREEEKSRKQLIGRLVHAIMHHPKQRCINCWFAKKTAVYDVQRGIKTNESHHGKRGGMLRSVRNLFHNSCSFCLK